jgi:2-C-methyl-D-erythritol 4-phosphate cytidylyltransferase
MRCSRRPWPDVAPSTARMAVCGQMTVAAILVAAGSGVRLGGEVPKAFVAVAGRTLLEHAASRFVGAPGINACVVVAPADRLDDAAALSGARAVAGGVTRQESVDAGLRVLPAEVDLVLIHDVARPFVPAAVIGRVLQGLARGADAVVPAVPITDTIKRVDRTGTVLATVDRTELVAVQTPQGFRRDVLVAAHAAAAHVAATDDAALVEAAGGRVVVVDGADEAFKVTRTWDLVLAEAVAAHG